MISPPARINVTDSMEEVMKKFDDTKAWNLPVINEEGNTKGLFPSPKYLIRTGRCWLISLKIK